MKDKSITREEFSQLAEFRSKTYGFLSLIFLQRPGEDFLKRMLDPNLRVLLSPLKSDEDFPKEIAEGLRIVEEYMDKSKKVSVEILRRELSIEYTRLFRGIKPNYGPPPPYESLYLEGKIIGERTLQVSKEYSKAGLVVPEQYHSEPPDHIGFELDFMRHLCHEEFLAWKENRLVNAISNLEQQQIFINEHLVLWVPTFTDKIVEVTSIDFYKGIAKLTKAYIQHEWEKINIYIQIARGKITN